MADISFNINSDDLNKLEKVLGEIRKELQKIAKSDIVGQDEVSRAKKMVAEEMKISNEIKKQKLASEKLAEQQDKFNRKAKESKGIIGGLEAETRKLRSQLKSATNPAQIDKLNRKLTDTRKRLAAAKQTTASWGKALGSFQFKFNALGNIASNVVSSINAGLKRALRDVINITKDFDQAMADVKSITNATDKELKALTDTAKQLGGSTRFTATQVAQLQKEYAKLGFTTEEIINAQTATLDLASATGSDLAEAATVAGATLRGFGLNAKQTSRVTDVMAKSFTSSALDMDKFRESMKYAAPVAKAAGVSIEETTSMLALLADAGIHGSMAGTALKKMMSELTNSGKPLSERLKELSKEGITLASAQDEVGERAKTALLVLSNQIDKIPELTQAFKDASGAAKEMADIQINTIAGQLDILKSSYEGLILELTYTEEKMGTTKKAISGLSDVLQLQQDVVRGEEEGFRKFQNVVGTISAPLIALTKLQIDLADKIFKGKEETEEAKIEMTLFGAAVGAAMSALGKTEAFDKFTGKLQELTKDDSEVKALVKILSPDAIEDVDYMNEILSDIEKLEDQRRDRQSKKDRIRNKEIKDEYRNRFKEEDQIKEEADAKELTAAQEKEARKREIYAQSFEMISGFTDSLATLYESSKQKELSAAGDNAAKREEIEKKYAKKQQNIAIAQAIINASQGALKTFNQFGFPLALPFMAAGAAMAGIQIATIKKQKFAKGGEVHGPLHSRGGVDAELEGGEYVINRRSASKYKGLIEGINENDQLKILTALDQDKGRGKVSTDPWTKKIYEQLASQEVYGETNDFYIIKRGNRKMMIRKR